jgi:hypothetical protein
MRIAILESIVMPAGHEVEFDRILVEELKKQGHEPVFFVPEHFPFKLDYHCDVEYLDGGEAISYAGAGRTQAAPAVVPAGAPPPGLVQQRLREGRSRAIAMPSSCRRTAGASCARYWNSAIKNSPVPVSVPIPWDHAERQGALLRWRQEPPGLLEYPSRGSGLADFVPRAGRLPELPYSHGAGLHPVRSAGHAGVPCARAAAARLLSASTAARRTSISSCRHLSEATFTNPVELTVQGATVTQADSDDFERSEAVSMHRMRQYPLPAQEPPGHRMAARAHGHRCPAPAIRCRALPLPAQRHAVHRNRLLQARPAVSGDESRDLCSEFKIGEAVKLDSVETFSKQMEDFVNTFPQKGRGIPPGTDRRKREIRAGQTDPAHYGHPVEEGRVRSIDLFRFDL